jgi:hypothetical protein
MNAAEQLLDIFTTFATDEKLEVEGVWRALQGDSRLLLARSGNERYIKKLNDLYTLHQQKLSEKTPEAEKLNRDLMNEVIASTILLGWENLSYKRKPIAYSVENAKMLLAHSEFRDKVVAMAQDMDAYRAKLEDEQLGN